MTKNLNLSAIRTDDGKGRALTDPATSTGTVECHFRDVKGALLREIERWPVVVGCVAWLTDHDVLRALAGRQGAAFVVQKEDFLRPDSGQRRDLRPLYEAIGGNLGRHWFNGVLGSVCTMSAEPTVGVRCVGNHNTHRRAAMPRAHHKFAVFCDLGDPGGRVWNIVPRAVWTGSFNWTNNATNSLENAVVIRDEKIAAAYLAEFEQVAALSEPLDWTNPWAPAWRIGT